MLVHKNHAAGGGNGSIMVGMFVSLCLASQKSSERELFLGVKLLNDHTDARMPCCCCAHIL
jgi:hypothetical protein